jgi:universal stress protein E
MTRFRRILVFAEHQNLDALDRVIALARQHGAELSVCDVVAPPPAYYSDDVVVEQIQCAELQYAFARLREFCAQRMDAVTAGFTVLTGSPYLAVIQQVIQSQFDLLVHMRDPTRQSGFDTTLAHFARKCPSPVWNLPVTDLGNNHEVAVAVDRAAHPGELFDSEMAASSLRMAAAILPDGGRIHLIHAWSPYGRSWLQQADTPLDEDAFGSHISAQRESYEAWFSEAVKAARATLPTNIELAANLHEGDLLAALECLLPTAPMPLVMGTVGGEAPRGLLIGSNAEALLVEGQRELVLVKPGAYVSPLQFGDSEHADDAGEE